MPALAFAGQEGPSVDAESASEDISLAASSGYKVDWTTSGDCIWSIDKSGNLVVRPAEGRSEGTLDSASPWSGYSGVIKTATFEEGVSATDATFSMFYGCDGLRSVNLSGLDTSKVTNMGYMFSGCSSLKSLDLSRLDTSNVTNMVYMFYQCMSLESLDLSSFDTANANTSGMFERCASLTSITLGSEFGKPMSYCSLRAPSGSRYSGKWVSSADGMAYSVDEIPRNVAATYTPEQQVPVYRMYNSITSEHLFTSSKSEYNSLTAHNWKQEGVSWYSPNAGSFGVYRLYNPGLGAMGRMSHHYTCDYAEAADLVANHGWRWDNGGQPIFYSAEDDSGNALDDASEVYRLYNDGLSAHHFTLDSDEYISLMRDHGWNGEGVAFYAYE